jgi:hypothetical protein
MILKGLGSGPEVYLESRRPTLGGHQPMMLETRKDH